MYPTIGLAPVTEGLNDIWVYIVLEQNMVAQYIVTRTIMDLCLEAERNPGL